MSRKIETQSVEFKSSWRDEFLKVICAFANTEGGVLFVGIDDNGKPVDIKNVPKLLDDIPNKIRNKLRIIPSVEVESKDGKEIIKVTIEAQREPISCDGKYYIRSGSSNFELSGSELVEFLLKKSGKGWDEVIVENAGFSDIDKDTVESFKKYAADRLPSIANENDDKLLLEKLNLTADGKLKRAAILLFGKNPQKFFPGAYLKIGKFLSPTDVITTDIVKGNLFEQLDRALDILRTKYLLSPITYEGIHRREILEYPYDALRESLLNALIHRNYSGSSNIQIRVYDERIVFMNEGKLPPEVPLEKLKTEHLSKPGNKLPAEVFDKAGFIESWGRGTLKILEECIRQGHPEPDFFEENNVFKVVLYKKKKQEMPVSKRQILLDLDFEPRDLVGQELRERYKVQAVIDTGGKGIIYKVFDNIEESVKAIKLFPPVYNFGEEAVERIKSEFKNIRMISHQNILQVCALDKDRGIYFILMEFIEGENLQQELERIQGGKLKENDALAIMNQAAAGLLEIHKKGILHRNVQLRNIMIEAGNIVKIINFGQSRQLKKSIKEINGDESLKTNTWAYLSSERISLLHLEEDEREDVWGFGVSLYRVLMGRIPFDSRRNILDPGFTPKIEGVTGKTKAVILKCLERDINKRYKNMEEVLADLKPG
ncbi:MAG: protein kinase [Candidatus Aminicenantes bacterium]|nr:protein kinase [Candidatus Aminicenantes bacterium]